MLYVHVRFNNGLDDGGYTRIINFECFVCVGELVIQDQIPPNTSFILIKYNALRAF